MLQRINIFANFTVGSEDIRDPTTQELAGHVLVITDKDTGEIWRIPLELSAARTIGQHLMGIKGVSPSTPEEMQRLTKINGRKR